LDLLAFFAKSCYFETPEDKGGDMSDGPKALGKVRGESGEGVEVGSGFQTIFQLQSSFRKQKSY
jgi:hypothetical protein